MQPGDEELMDGADAEYRGVCLAERALLQRLVQIDRRELWRDTEAACMAHWVSMRYGVSYWKADRWMQAAYALEDLPLVSEAFCAGDLGIDRVVELTRLAKVSSESEASLLHWGERHAAGAIRARADKEIRWSAEQVKSLQQQRSLTWGFYDEGRRFAAALDVPAAEGAVFAKAIMRQVDRLPGADRCIEARRADALMMMASAQVGADPDPDRATIVLHTTVQALAQGAPAELEGGGVIDAPTLQRLGCHARVQSVMEDSRGNAFALGRMSREPSAAMVRQLRYRERDCQFPACAHRRFTNVHHIVHWARGGRTDLENLVLICTYHHKLVHELGWGIKRESDGTVSWFYPDGYPYRAGPAPPPCDGEISSRPGSLARV
jgi:HNH endonuclease